MPTCRAPKDSVKASFILAGFSNNVPFAPAKAPALNTLRKCVGMDKTVFAICDKPFGNKIIFLYPKVINFSGNVAPFLSPLKNALTLLALPMPSAISLDVNVPFNGLTILPLFINGSKNSSNSTIS